MFSSFISILQRGGKYNLMRAYGTYTCFAPTNEAIDRYLFEQDSIYKESLKPGSKKVIWTGVTSTKLEDLSDSMCTVIAQTHIIPKTYLTTEMEGDVIIFADSSICLKYKPARSLPCGMHGYDNRNPLMNGIFYAIGPDFKKGFSAPQLYNIDIYELLCRVLEIQPAKNDGQFERIQSVLR